MTTEFWTPGLLGGYLLSINLKSGFIFSALSRWNLHSLYNDATSSAVPQLHGFKNDLVHEGSQQVQDRWGEVDAGRVRRRGSLQVCARCMLSATPPPAWAEPKDAKRREGLVRRPEAAQSCGVLAMLQLPWGN